MCLRWGCNQFQDISIGIWKKKIKFSFLPRNQEGCITLTPPLRLHTYVQNAVFTLWTHTRMLAGSDWLLLMIWISCQTWDWLEKPLDEWKNVHIGFKSRRNCVNVEGDPDLIWMLNEDPDQFQYTKTNGPILSSLLVSVGLGPENRC